MTPDSETSFMMRITQRFTRCARGARAIVACTVGAVGLGVTGCHDAGPVIANPDGSRLLWTVTNAVGAVTMEAGTTFQLDLTPRYPSGEAVTGLPPSSFTSNGPTKVTVGPTGLLTALEPTSAPVQIVGTYTLGGISIADTVLVAVTAARERVKSFVFQDIPATFPVNTFNFVAATVKDSSDADLFDLTVNYTTSDPTVAYFSSGSFITLAKGTTTVYATATAYGVTYRDSVTVTVTNPVNTSFIVAGPYWQNLFGDPPLSPNFGVIGVGGTVTFSGLYVDPPSSITFLTGGDSLPANANVPVFTDDATVGPFLVPGSYLFKIATGDTARIYVLP
jgi:hypothetical protein